jgi:MFS family permease
MPEPAPQQEAKALSWSSFISTYLPALVLALGTGIALPAVPTLARSFHVSFGVATGVTTAFLIGSVLGTLPTGWLIDRLGRRKVMLVGPLLTAAMAFLVVTATSFDQLLVYRFFDGMASQMWLIGRLAGISHNAAPSQRGKQVSWLFGMDNTGKLAGPVAGGFLATAWGDRAPFLAYGILALLAFIPGFLFLKDTPRRAEVAATSAASAAAAAKSGAGPGPAPAAGKFTVRDIVRGRVVYFGVAFFAALARGPVQADLLYLYAAFAYHLSPRSIGFLATSATCISLPLGFFAGWMMDRFGRKRTMLPGFTGVVLTMSALAVTAWVHISFPWYVVIFLTGIAMQSLTGGSIQTIGADVAPPQARGRFLGMYRFTGQAGVAVSPVVFAFLADNVDYGASFVFIASAAATVSYLLLRHVPETGQRRPAEHVGGLEGAAAAITSEPFPEDSPEDLPDDVAQPPASRA